MPASAPDDARLRAATAQFEAVLFSKAFEPLAKAMGFFGDAVVESALRSVTSAGGRDGGGL